MSLQKVRKTKLTLPQMKNYQNLFRSNVLQKQHRLKNHIFFQNSINVAQIFILCFSKVRKFRQILILCFTKCREIRGKFCETQKFREITKTKIFAATLYQPLIIHVKTLLSQKGGQFYCNYPKKIRIRTISILEEKEGTPQ